MEHYRITSQHTYARREQEVTHYATGGAQFEIWSNPQSQTLYARNRARHEDSMMLVLRSTNPMIVKKMNAVKATPSRVEESGDEAAAG